MVPELFRSSLFCAGAEGRAETAAEGEAGVAPAAVTVTLLASGGGLVSKRMAGLGSAYFQRRSFWCNS